MLTNTNAIPLKCVKYGDTSLIVTMFTALYGVETYMLKGVRKGRNGRSGLLQPGTLLELVVYMQPGKNMQYVREFQPAYLYTAIQEDVVKNTILLFSAELLLRLLPEHAPMPALFDMAYMYLTLLDKAPAHDVPNYPLFFLVQCCRELGYGLTGRYSAQTPHLNLQEGGYTAHPPPAAPYTEDEDARALNTLLDADSYEAAARISMNGAMRLRLTQWYISFLQQHTLHMGQIKSLAVLQAILH